MSSLIKEVLPATPSTLASIFSPEFEAVLASTPSHAFLLNKNTQMIYCYLCSLVLNYCQRELRKSLSEIQILDWGCGKGHISYILRKMGANVTSADARLPDYAQDNDSAFGQETPILSKFEIPVVPLEHEYVLPFEEKSFDVVLSFGVLEHVKNDAASLREISRILTPEGIFFCFELPYVTSWTQRLAHLRGDYYHDRLYSKKQVMSLLQQAGLKMEHFWHRQLFPKKKIHFSNPAGVEKLDLFLTTHTWFKYFATNIEFIARKYKE